MNEQQWNEALNEIDEELVENYVQQKEGYARKKNRRKIWRRVGATAACLCLVLGMVIFLGRDDRPDPNIPINSDHSHSHVTLWGLFATNDSTNSYRKIYVADSSYLNLSQIPEEETVELYRRVLNKELDRKGLETTLSTVVSKLEDYLDVEMPEFEIKERENEMRVSTEPEGFWFEARQNPESESYLIVTQSSAEAIYLGDEIVQIDQTLSDAEIVASLESVKKKLFDIFGVSFTDVRIERYFDGYSQHGATSISAFFYNAADEPFKTNFWDQSSDYICLAFPNRSDSSKEGSDDVIFGRKITYLKNRDDYESVKSLRKITLEEAEKLLKDGFCFGASCPLCMANQREIDFENYDYVEFSYVIGMEGNVENMGFPFYVFYKQIGTAKNGNLIYAQTYVPAIEVKELAEYFPVLKQTPYYCE